MSMGASTSAWYGNFGGRVVLVSGGASGIGAACVESLCVQGARVVFGDIRDQQGETLADQVNERSGKRLTCYRHLDVSRDRDWRDAVETAEAEFGGLDILVNNAGISARAGVADLDEKTWAHVVAVNQTGVWLGMRAVAPALRRRGGGSIVNVSSIYGIVGTPASAAYHATKGAVRLLTKSAALELGPDRIRVNSVHPGYITTSMTETLPDDRIHALLEQSALKRAGSASEVAAAVAFLASDAASFVTGAELVVDGGYTAG
jgi:cyclopentanol dehydrogenase